MLPTEKALLYVNNFSIDFYIRNLKIRLVAFFKYLLLGFRCGKVWSAEVYKCVILLTLKRP
jgi:hypothetical protein